MHFCNCIETGSRRVSGKVIEYKCYSLEDKSPLNGGSAEFKLYVKRIKRGGRMMKNKLVAGFMAATMMVSVMSTGVLQKILTRPVRLKEREIQQ